MAMLLKANFEHIPDNGAVPMIAGKNIRACLPARFAGKDADMVAAEAAFDVLNNLAASTTQDMGYERGLNSGWWGGCCPFCSYTVD